MPARSPLKEDAARSLRSQLGVVQAILAELDRATDSRSDDELGLFEQLAEELERLARRTQECAGALRLAGRSDLAESGGHR